MSILMCIISAVIITAIIILFAYICYKEPKVLIATLFIALILVGIVVAPTVA